MSSIKDALTPVFDHTSGLSVFDPSPGVGEGTGVRERFCRRLVVAEFYRFWQEDEESS
jgi:hypothetical protein